MFNGKFQSERRKCTIKEKYQSNELVAITILKQTKYLLETEWNYKAKLADRYIGLAGHHVS